MNQVSLVLLNIGNGFEFQTGRFNKEFVEKEKISEEGSYGILWRARHSVDGCYYAVKEIPFYYKDEEKLIRIKKEVQIQAKCCHPNVISYKTSWLEECIDINDYGISQSSSDLNLSSATISTIDQSGSNTLEGMDITRYFCITILRAILHYCYVHWAFWQIKKIKFITLVNRSNW